MPLSDFKPELLRYIVEGLRIASKEAVLLIMKTHN
jgi:hypothetical protein